MKKARKTIRNAGVSKTAAKKRPMKPATAAQAPTEKEPEAAKGLSFPPIAVALLLDEWRRATMEGQGGHFLRLPRERYDGSGNLWSIVRRPGVEHDSLVLIREGSHYQRMSAINDADRIEAEIATTRRLHEAVASTLKIAVTSRDSLRAASYRETLEALDANLRQLEARLAAARERAGKAEKDEWVFSLGLEGIQLVVSRG